jgi:hypothetical protein
MAAITDAGMFEGTDTATPEETMVITMPGTMEATDVVTLAADSMAADLSTAAVGITVEAVASTVVVDTGKQDDQLSATTAGSEFAASRFSLIRVRN